MRKSNRMQSTEEWSNCYAGGTSLLQYCKSPSSQLLYLHMKEFTIEFSKDIGLKVHVHLCEEIVDHNNIGIASKCHPQSMLVDHSLRVRNHPRWNHLWLHLESSNRITIIFGLYSTAAIMNKRITQMTYYNHRYNGHLPTKRHDSGNTHLIINMKNQSYLQECQFWIEDIWGRMDSTGMEACSSCRTWQHRTKMWVSIDNRDIYNQIH